MLYQVMKWVIPIRHGNHAIWLHKIPRVNKKRGAGGALSDRTCTQHA
jgi:hypothetical protein